MATAARRPTNSDSSSWTDEHQAYLPPQYAYVTSSGVSVVYHTHLFDSPLPDDINIDGIEVELVGYKDETSGSGSLRFGVELSWDGGTTWTSIKYTGFLTASSAAYTVGGSSDTWSHSWTRTEIADTSKFRCRITSGNSGGVLDTPDWRLEASTVTIHYSITHALTINDSMFMTDAQNMSRKKLVLRDGFSMSDSAAFDEPVGARPQQQKLTLGGGAIDKLASSPNIAAAALNGVRRESYGAFIVMLGTTPFIAPVGTVVTQDAMDTSNADAPSYQEGMSELGDIKRTGLYGQGSNWRSARLRFHNKDLYSLLGQHNSLASAMKAARATGASFVIYVFVEDADGSWHKDVVLEGKLEWCKVNDASTDVVVVDRHEGAIKVPTLSVTESSFIYGDDEGELPEEWVNKPVPVGYGHFNMLAHGKNLYSIITDVEEGSGFAGLLGLPAPSMPVVLASVGYKREDGTSDDNILQHAMFLQGDSRTPAIEVNTKSVGNFRFPIDRTEADADNTFVYSSLHTWDSEFDRAALFGCDFSQDQQEAIAQGLLLYAGAGDWRERRSFLTYGNARYSVPVFLNIENPNISTSTFTDRWSGAIGMIAIPMAGVGYFNPQGYFKNQGIWSTDDGSLGTAQERVQRILSDDYDSWAKCHISVGGGFDGSAYFQALASAQDRGDIVAIRVCAITEYVSGRPPTKLTARYCGGDTDYELVMHPNVNTTGGGAQDVDCSIADVAQNTYFSGLLKRAQEDFIQRTPPTHDNSGTFIVPSDARRVNANLGYTSPWKFVHTTGLNLAYVLSQDYATEIGVLIEPPPSGTKVIKFYAVWLEVVHTRSIFNSRNSVAPGGAVQRQASSLNSDGVRANVAGSAGNFLTGLFTGGAVRPFRSNRPSVHTPPPLNLPYSGNIKDFEKPRIGIGNFFVYGDGPTDDGSGTYTGSANKLIESPADIAGHLLAHYTTSFGSRATGTNFGSFIRARTMLGSGAELVLPIHEQDELQGHFDRIGYASMSFIDKQAGQWRMFVDTDDPATDCPERIYGTTFDWNTIIPGSFTVDPSELKDIKAGFAMNYKFNVASGKYHGKLYCDAYRTNVASDAGAYRTACQSAANGYDASDILEIDMPDVWDEAWAEVLFKWFIDKRTRDFRVVEFDTYLNAIDLYAGHIINISDDVESPPVDGIAGIPYPGSVGGSDWSDHTFDVIDATLQFDDGQPTKIHVTAVETYSKAV